MDHKLQLSHVLYRVQDLHQAVGKLQDAGFIVEYGTTPEKAYNAFIWFEHGVFIEIYNNARLPAPVQWLMKLLGYQPVLDRMDKWQQTENGWCEWSLESTDVHLDAEKYLLKRQHIPFKFHKTKRKDIKSQVLRWELLMPNDIMFPFIMSAYVPNLKPKKVQHPNGVKSVTALVVGKEQLNTALLSQLLSEETGLKFIDGKAGLQEVELDDSSINITAILK